MLAQLNQALVEMVPWAKTFDGYEPFPRGITPSNLDGCVHLLSSNRMLVLEAKRETENTSRGQRKALEGIAHSDVDVLIVWFSDGWRVVKMEHVGKWPGPRTSENRDFVNFCHKWSLWAQTNSKQKCLSGFSWT